LDELSHTSSGLLPTDKRLADDFQMIGDVNIFLHGAIPPPQPSSPQIHLTTSSGISTLSSLHLSAKEFQSQDFFEEEKKSEEDLDDGGDGGDFQAEVEILIAEPSFRRKGLALEALQLMLGYASGQPEAFAVDMSNNRVTIFSKSDLTSKSCSATLPSIIYHIRKN